MMISWTELDSRLSIRNTGNNGYPAYVVKEKANNIQERCIRVELTSMKFFHQLILLLVTLPGTKATPLRPNQHRPFQPVTSTLERGIQSLKVENLEATLPVHILDLMVLHNTPGKIDSTEARVRPRRTPPRGCQLGTCQLHNLANTLYRIGQTNGKDESKKANDPQGYGR
ncbi:hypothetical protein SKAU_G00131450 [Synaphobranchus kaupii]|uniref:Adrenomedullin n=1 Tax=Synaphobranchus kaupii TaxID=118154 RepID=A0A9Q1FQP9_SYNKA|nr:hypothetical protein SKAU_G00131450 [Synaphobranchus kaupii]